MGTDRNLVYVVDDEPGMVLVLQDVLSIEGYSVAGGRSLEEAMAYLRANVPSCVVSDNDLKSGYDNDGLNLLESIARDPRLRSVGMVMLSGRNANHLDERVRELGGEFLMKPPECEQVISAVRTQISLHQQQ